MVKRRWGKRYSTEVQVRFGEMNLDHHGLVQDMSLFGFFIVTAKPYPVGTNLKIEISTKDGKIAELLGRVQWSKERPQTSVWISRDGGLGILIKSFLKGQEHYEKLCQQLCKTCALEIKSTCPINSEDKNTPGFSFRRKFIFKKS